MATRFFSRYKNYSLQVQVLDNKVTCNFTPWGEFGQFYTEDSNLETALYAHPKVTPYGEIGDWIAPPGKDVVYTDQDPASMILPPSSESGTIAQPFGLTLENFPHFLNNLDIVLSVDQILGVNGLKLNKQINGIVIPPISIGDASQIGDLMNTSPDGDKYSLIVERDGIYAQCILFGVANAKVISSPDPFQLLYGIIYDEPGNRGALTSERIPDTTTNYPLAIYLGEPIDNFMTKVFFFGGISYPIYNMVSEMIYAALNP